MFIAYDFDPAKLVIESPVQGSDISPKDQRFKIRYLDDDNELTNLVLAPYGTKFFTFGITKASSFPGSVESVGFCIPSKSDIDEERAYHIHLSNAYFAIVNALWNRKGDVKHLPKMISKDDFTSRFSTMFSPSKMDPDVDILWTKIRKNPKTDEVWTRFFGEDLNRIDMRDIKGYFKGYPAVILESVYVSKTGIHIQKKLSECVIEPVEMSSNGPSLKMFEDKLGL